MGFRKTRNSDIIDELGPPYEVTLLVAFVDNQHSGNGLLHAVAKVTGGSNYNTCCRLRRDGIWTSSIDAPTCFDCAKCKGCYCCRTGHIREETVWMGKWETKDGRHLYPFEMDSTHLMNSIAKLKRDETHFKRNWRDWLKTLEVEARLRGLL